ncbi:MAG: S49 family peptidase [Rhodobacteraceae bacterium]|nr:S49 family peptidase [Paracoccaceae bacterium]
MRRWIPFLKARPRVAVVRLSGMISSGGRFVQGLSDDGLAQTLDRAFTRGKPSAVALSINSPGGSAVQSSLIGARIRRLAEERSVPVYAFVEDVAASGGYWIAVQADEIWADPASILGSIGVISASFGAHDFIARHGIERRVHTAGRSKSMLDPFRPEKDEDVQRLNRILEQIHAAFIDQVKSRRGAKLGDGEDLFTGDVWIGRQAVDRGLADGIGHLVPKMQERFGKDVKFLVYGAKRSLLQRLGLAFMDNMVATVEERALFARYGL